jgi:poly(beta-D-mannuronate) C5 epimerase
MPCARFRSFLAALACVALLCGIGGGSAAAGITSLQTRYLAAEAERDPVVRAAAWQNLLDDKALTGTSLVGVSRDKVVLNLVQTLMERARAESSPEPLREATDLLKYLKDAHPAHYLWSYLAVGRAHLALGVRDEALRSFAEAARSLERIKGRQEQSQAASGLVLALLWGKEGAPVLGEAGLRVAPDLMERIFSAQHYATAARARALALLARDANSRETLRDLAERGNAAAWQEFLIPNIEAFADSDPETALRYAQAMPLTLKDKRKEALTELHRELVRKQRLGLAVEAARSIAGAMDQSDLLAEDAAAMMQRKEYDRAARLATLIDDGRRASEVWMYLTRVYAESGYEERAKSALAEAEAAAMRTREPDRRAAALARLAKVAAETDQIETAQRLLAQTEKSARAPALAALAKRMAERGRLDEAEALLEDAKGAEGEEGGAFDKARLAFIKECIERSQEGRARDMLEEIRDSAVRARAETLFDKRAEAPTEQQKRVRQALEHVRKGKVEEAAALARGIQEDRVRVRTFRRIAEIQARDTDFYNLLPGASSAQKKKLTPLAQDGNARAREQGKELEDELLKEDRNKGEMLLSRTPPPSALGVQLPVFPEMHRLAYDRDGIAKKIPPITAARVRMMSYEHVPYNLKFLYALGRTSFVAQQKTSLPQVIYLEKGVADLSTVYDALRRRGVRGAVSKKGRVYTLNRPLIVAPEATLVVAGTDTSELRMSQEQGAYLVNAGTLFIVDTKVSGWSELRDAPAFATKQQIREFRPFLLSWSLTRTYIAGSTFTALGYSNSKSYGISLSSGPEKALNFRPANIPRPEAVIVDSSFRNMLYGFYSFEADNVVLVGNEYVDNIIYGIDPHDRSRWFTIAYNTAYATDKKHGIIISREVNNSTILGNLSFDNHGSGLMVDRQSSGTFVYANTAFANGQDGLTIFESSCKIIASNRFFSNHRSGIKVRNSMDVGVYYNELTGNRHSGVHGYVSDLRTDPAHRRRDFALDPYSDVAAMNVVGNRIEANGVGVQAEGMVALLLRGNAFARQAPRLLDGDWSREFSAILAQRDMNQEGVVMTPRCPRAKYVLREECKFREQGYFDGDGQGNLHRRLSRPSCAETSGNGAV